MVGGVPTAVGADPPWGIDEPLDGIVVLPTGMVVLPTGNVVSAAGAVVPSAAVAPSPCSPGCWPVASWTPPDRAGTQAGEAEDRVEHEVRAADRREPEGGVRLGAQRVVDLGDDLGDAERLGGQLRGHHVAVVALGQGQEQVRALGSGPPEHVLVRAVAADGVALERGLELVEGRGRLVDDRDLVAGPVESLGDGGADAPAADDEGLHAVSSGMGSRTTHTVHRAFFRQYGMVRPMAKSPPKRLR